MDVLELGYVGWVVDPVAAVVDLPPHKAMRATATPKVLDFK
jgi:hypothetical protein